ncbi:MAG TPA: ABC transporter substrate-binding protein [Candidatus Sulfotelmatobacter sp.]|nr:ABC transporter substrate-binding protein [Candidatus Sulfotelmatobacter sp.]
MRRWRSAWWLPALIALSAVLLPLSPALSAQKGPIKIGFLAPQTGNFAQLGLDMVDGIKMYLQEINYTVAGRKIELIVDDEGDNPSTAVTKARKLITQDGVHLASGIFMTSAAYAVAPVFDAAQVPLMISVSAGDDLTQRKHVKYVSRLAPTGGEIGHAAGDYAYKKLGWRKAVILGFDYAWGYENAGGFQRVFEDLGGQVIQKTYAPVATADFGPYIANLKHDADGVFDVITGAASVRFLKALRASGLMDKWKVLIPGTGTDEAILPAIGDAGLGVISFYHYSGAIQTPENEKFAADMRRIFKKEPSLGSALSYTAGQWLVKAIEAINGDVENKEKLVQAIGAVELSKSVRGPMKMDKYGHAVQNMYVRRVDKVGTGYQNTVVDVYPMFGQFYKYDPETFLKSPVYSRDYPPCKFCQ